MSVKVKPGRWQMRSGDEAVVCHDAQIKGWTWRGYLCKSGIPASWTKSGLFDTGQTKWDLVKYLGPEESQIEG